MKPVLRWGVGNLYRLFLVDDENGQLELMEQILKKMNSELEILCFTSPKDALESMRRNPAHIIISDIRMPQMDGLTFIRLIRRQYPDTVIAILSAYGDFSYARQAMTYSVIDFLVKPVNRQELQELLNNILTRLAPQNFPYISPKEFEQLERSVISAVYESSSEKVNTIMEQFLRSYSGRELTCSRTVTIQNFCHLSLVLHRQLSLEPSDMVFKDFDSCTSLPQLCESVQHHILRIIEERKKIEKQSGAHIVDEITQFIEKNLDKELSLHSIARQFHFNPSYLSNLFKKQTGTGLKEYIVGRRIEYAKDLLCNTEWKIHQISVKCGYEDVSYFVQMFKKHTGFSPGQFRKRS